MKYDIKAHPTMYNGVQYRSRLEARWAAFFDLIGWKHEYEPIDLPGWSPDFLLKGCRHVLVEIKPVYQFPYDVALKIDSASPEDRSPFECLIIGNAPFSNAGSTYIGWLRSMDDWSESPFMYIGSIDFCHCNQSFQGRMTGQYDGNWGDEEYAAAIVDRCWKQAGNIVQWIARRQRR